jgi:hypothetical protein
MDSKEVELGAETGSLWYQTSPSNKNLPFVLALGSKISSGFLTKKIGLSYGKSMAAPGIYQSASAGPSGPPPKPFPRKIRRHKDQKSQSPGDGYALGFICPCHVQP